MKKSQQTNLQCSLCIFLIRQIICKLYASEASGSKKNKKENNNKIIEENFKDGIWQ